jgi:hypothetical protein
MGQAADRFDVLDVVARLRHAKARILQTTEWARSATEVWVAFNQAETWAIIAASPASRAASVYERAVLDMRIVMVTRLLDQPGRGGANGTNRISFPVCQGLLSLPGVLNQLAAEAADWRTPDPTGQRVRERHRLFVDRLARIEGEVNPNRAKRLRDFRDENIAHELRFEELRARPEYRDITNLLAEVMALTSDLAFITEGEHVLWAEGEIERSTNALWAAVAARFPLG